MMFNQPNSARCPATWEVDTWVVTTYAKATPADDALGNHLLSCPTCMRRAAMSWALLPEPVHATIRTAPSPHPKLLSLDL